MLFFRKKKTEPAPQTSEKPLSPITVEQMEEWQQLVQEICENTRGETAQRSVRLRLLAANTIQQLEHAKDTVAQRAKHAADGVA